MGIKINEELLEERLAEIEKARLWSPRVIAKLEGLIRSGDDYSLFRINPLKFGSEKNISEQEAIDLFLYGAKFGLFQMNWQLLCPGCGDVVESFSTLRTLDSHYHCDLCQKDFEAALDDYIERFNQEHGARELILKIGIHKGAVIAVTLNDRLDYFGQTMNIASRVQRLADADEIYVTHDVYTYPRVQELLKGFEIVLGKAKLRGVQEEMQVYKINRNLKR